MKAKQSVVILLSVGLLCFNAQESEAPVDVPDRYMKDFTSEAPVICAGVVDSYFLLKGEVVYDGHSYDGWATMNFMIDHAVKGEVAPGLIKVQLHPTFEAVIPRIRFPVRRKRYLIFFKPVPTENSLYRLLYWEAIIPLSPSVPTGIREDLGVKKRLELELLATLRTHDETIYRSASIRLLELDRESEEFLQALKEISESKVPKISAMATATRMSLGDMSVLPLAISYVDSEDAEHAKVVGSAFSQMKDPEAIPELIRCLESKHVTVRRAAMEALRSIASPELRQELESALRFALDDSNRMVQYDAMFGLGRVRYGKRLRGYRSGDAPMLPATKLFFQNPM